jgi:predicted GNAT family acetyltransferase
MSAESAPIEQPQSRRFDADLGCAIVAAMDPITDNSARSRFELMEDGKLAFADYRLEGNLLILPHVEADPALRGRGAAGRLMDGILRHAQSQGWKVRPICGYAAAYLARHPHYRSLLE